MIPNRRSALLLVLLSFQLCLVCGTLTPSKRKHSKTGNGTPAPKELKANSGPVELSVRDRDLVQEEPLSRDIYAEGGTYWKNTGARNFSGTVLGYVTPWNNHGYNVAKTFSAKFDVISPVWLQVQRKANGKYELHGKHDLDMGWADDVRRLNKNTKVLPRFLFDKFTDDDFGQMLTHEHEQQLAIDVMVNAVRRFKLDGIVLEMWSQLSGRIDDTVLYKLVRMAARALHKHDKLFVLVVPPVRKHMHDLFSARHFQQLVDDVDAFSLMTYDYSSIERPGANAPKYWVEQAVRHICPDGTAQLAERRAKILIGLNMYGNDFTLEGGGSITSREYLPMVKALEKRLALDETDEENYFEFKDDQGKHYVFYPTLYSINQRVELAKQLGCGLSLWELGQGLDYFYDLI